MAKSNYLAVHGYHANTTHYYSSSKIPIYNSTSDVSGQKYINVQLPRSGVGYIPLVDTTHDRASRVKVQWSDGNVYALEHQRPIEASDIDYIEFRVYYHGTGNDDYSLGSYTIANNYIETRSPSSSYSSYLSGRPYIVTKDGNTYDFYHTSIFYKYTHPIQVNMTNKMSFYTSGCGYYFSMFSTLFDYGYISGTNVTRYSTASCEQTASDNLYDRDSYFDIRAVGYCTTRMTITSVTYNGVSVPFKFTDNVSTYLDNEAISTCSENETMNDDEEMHTLGEGTYSGDFLKDGNITDSYRLYKEKENYKKNKRDAIANKKSIEFNELNQQNINSLITREMKLKRKG